MRTRRGESQCSRPRRRPSAPRPAPPRRHEDDSVMEERLKIAVFVDFDNIEIGVKTTLNVAFDVGTILEAIKERGEVVMVPEAAALGRD